MSEGTGKIKTQKSEAQYRYEELAKLNENVFNSPAFNKGCTAAGIPPSTRQASKFRSKRGLAYQNRFK
jgi:hypothetical protein